MLPSKFTFKSVKSSSYHIMLRNSQAADISISPYCKRTSWQVDCWGGVAALFTNGVTTVIFAIPVEQLYSWWTKSCTSSRNWDHLVGIQDELYVCSPRARHLCQAFWSRVCWWEWLRSWVQRFGCFYCGLGAATSRCLRQESSIRAERQLWEQVSLIKAATQSFLRIVAVYTVTSWNWKKLYTSKTKEQT